MTYCIGVEKCGCEVMQDNDAKVHIEYCGKHEVRQDFDEIYNLGKKRGIKEVSEFVSDLIIGIEGCEFEERLDGDKGCIVLDMNENQWQAKLKEWGISEK